MRRLMGIGSVVLALMLMAASCGKRTGVDVKGVMISLKTAMTEADKYGNPITTDFEKAKSALQQIEENFIKLKGSKAPKGDQKEWDSLHDQAILAAQKGIKACETKDKKSLAAALVELNSIMIKGHLKFRM